ncbi:MAG TPA: helix-turn-helix transcriptional regulator [Patescibacteria group bacterium]|nr:helix-turn-helix transcriptional regulator [Patescibacteria group bacterium]
MIPIGQKIKKARKEKKMTQEELADNNISRSLISLIENGLSYPSMQTLEYLATKLNKHISYFLVENDTDSLNLITDLEYLLNTEEYSQIIEKGEGFIKHKLKNIEETKNQYLGILYCVLGIAYHKTKNNKAYEYLSNSIDYLKSEGNNKYISQAYNCLGLVMYSKNNYEQMEHYLKLADSCINIITFENVNQKLNILYNLSLAYYYQHKYSLTMDILQEALMHSKKHELYYKFGEFNMLLALVYKSMDKIEDAIDCNIKAVKYYKLTENKYMEYRCYINLSILSRINNDYYNALNYINDAIIYFQSIGDETKLINAKVEKLISMFILNKDRDMILEMIDGIMNNPNCNNPARGELLTILAYLKIKSRDYISSLSLFKEAEKLLYNNNDTEMNIFIYHGLSIIYEKSDDQENASIYLAKLNKLLQEKPHYNRYIYNDKTPFSI